MYHGNDYDVAGFIVGAVDRTKIIDGSAIRPGDKIIGIASNGLHTNGYSLARKVAFELKGHSVTDQVAQLDMSIGDALLAVHTNYARAVTPLLLDGSVHGMAHITGGGIPGNLVRVLSEGIRARIMHGSWHAEPIFSYLAIAGDLDHDDMFAAFNMGIGYILVVDAAAADKMIESILPMHRAWIIGEIINGSKGVEFV
jgi:phosphoribosylformylglycinamidine cyclo-ligase